MKKTVFTLMIAIGALVANPSFGQSATSPGVPSAKMKAASSASVMPPAGAKPTGDKVAATTEKDPMVYVTKTGKSYHTKDCKFAKTATPMKLSEASKKYTPCGVCKPPVAANTNATPATPAKATPAAK